ncbi:hypothetical protein MP228_008493 [Amoeboaphelidium protococcarum]|nr:hypothetical protein MP228_008493 [Amoeboaphelidium protococcarum]
MLFNKWIAVVALYIPLAAYVLAQPTRNEPHQVAEISREISTQSVWRQRFQPLRDQSAVDLGVIQSLDLSLWKFLASSLSFFPPQWRHQIAYQYQKRVKRPHNQWHAVIAPDAVDNQLDMLVRMTVTIGIAMHAVRHESKPDFRTALDVKIFTKLWAPVMKYWKPIHQWQSGNLHGLVIYENEQERTLAVIFRPYTDPKVLGNHINSFLTDPEAYSEAVPMSYVSALDGQDKVFDIYGQPIMVVNPLVDEYIPMEMEVLSFLQEYRATKNPKADKIVTGGISAAGVYAQLFAIRTSLLDLNFMNEFVFKHAFAFNTPPAFHKSSPFEGMLDAMQAGGWQYSRVATDDFCSVYWLGHHQTADHVVNYGHLGNAIHMTTDPERVPQQFKNALYIYKNNDVRFPDRCFRHMPVNSLESLQKAQQSKLFDWIKLHDHVLKVGMSVQFIANALKRALNLSQKSYEALMWPRQLQS